MHKSPSLKKPSEIIANDVVQTISFGQAIRDGFYHALAQDSRVCIMGEGVTDPKGIFGTTTGLIDKFGPHRVMEMPVAENGFTGVAIGAALVGQRPVLIHQRVDFCLLALEQLFNNAAKFHYMSAGQHRVPLVVRLIIGRGWGQGPQHSQSLESIFAHIPGLKVVMPATAADAQGLLLGAIADDNPVIFLEHRWLHHVMGDVPRIPEALPLDGPKVRRTGSDITIVATSLMVVEALRAADALAAEGIQAEVIDLRVLRPLAMSPLLQSVRKTGRLLTVDTGWGLYGVGAEIVAQVAQQCLPSLKAPPHRLATADHPTPSSRALVENFYVSATSIVQATATILGLDDEAQQRLRQATALSTPVDVPNLAFKGPF